MHYAHTLACCSPSAQFAYDELEVGEQIGGGGFSIVYKYGHTSILVVSVLPSYVPACANITCL